ncbi:hypothetical protein [Candidatus Thiosymbion oneisti]|uniref:hypothetical protein n=1 Tax=Candidatus Thiosymbion oneisti TaxID=589554 RepID=UPI0015B757F3|nr:hypothetical protein [Candidatus Thiosymbion oneisti]
MLQDPPAEYRRTACRNHAPNLERGVGQLTVRGLIDMKSSWLKAAIDSDRPILIFLFFFPWSIWFIYRTSFTIDDIRYFCLFDDAMISMAYAKNLVNGYGLNWARFGEPVEGFTTPLWTFLMIPVNALPVGLNYKSLFIQVFSMILLALNILMIRKLMVTHFGFGAKRYWFPAAVLTASYYPLNFWALQGMESGLQVLLVTSSIYLAFSVIEKKSSPVTLLSLFAVAYLVRMDMMLLVLVILGFIAYQPGFIHVNRRSWLIGFAIFGMTIVSYSIFRWVYFHELLPNTYYLKLTGVPFEIRILRGLDVFVKNFFLPISIPLLLIIAGTLPLVRIRPKLGLPLLIIGTCFGYSIYVGGDVWEYTNVGANRFVTVAMPMLFVLFNALLNQGLDYLDQRKKPSLARDRAVIIFVSLIFSLFFNGFFLSPWNFGEEFRKFTVIKRPAYSISHDWVIRKSMELQTLLQPASIVATGLAGVPAYFTDFRMVDLLGYNEKTIAGMDIPPLSRLDFKKYLPGHLKTDIPYILAEYRPDFFFFPPKMPEDFWQSRGYEYRGELKGWHKVTAFSET